MEEKQLFYIIILLTIITIFILLVIFEVINFNLNGKKNSEKIINKITLETTF